MSGEISKRDSQSRVIIKCATFSENISASTSQAEVQIMHRELDAAWQRFQVLHDLVLNRAGASENEKHEHVASEIHDIYTAASIRFQTALATLRKHAAVHMSPPPPPKATMSRHHAVARMLVNIGHTVAATINTFDAAAAAFQLAELDDLHTQYRMAVLDAMQVSLDADAAQLIEAQADIRGSYLRTVALVQGVINRSAPAPPVAQPPEHVMYPEVKIAAVQIGTFDGTSAKWESFRESYEQVYHLRQSMPAVQKLAHLKSCLRGEAEELISNFSLTNENYETAWALLKQRYDNPYELTRAHLRTLYALPSCEEKAADLRKLMNRTSSTLLALRNLKRPVDHWDDFIVVLVIDKLDIESRKLWEQANCSGTVFPKWTALETFIENRVRALDAIGSIKSSSPASSASSSPAQQRKVRAHTITVAKQHVCPMCADDHAIYMCHEFRQLNVVDRRALVSIKRLCFRCLGTGHMATNCKSTRSCRFCDQGHNSLLHIDHTPPMTPSTSVEPATPPVTPTTATHAMMGLNPSRVMLSSALVHVRDSNGEMHSLRALLDSGSQSSFISEHAVQVLGLQKQNNQCDMVGIGEASCGRATHSVSATIHSRHSAFSVPITALVLRNVSRIAGMPMHETHIWPHLNGLALADPDYQHPSSVDLLLGAEVYAWCLLPELRKAGADDPVGQNSQFGWLISGPTSGSTGTIVQTNQTSVSVNFLSSNRHIEAIELRRSKAVFEETCEANFNASRSCDSDGRFDVRIPLHKPLPAVGDPLRMASQRQLQMKREFAGDATVALEFSKSMTQYHKLGHMKLIASVANATQQPELLFNKRLLPGPLLQDDRFQPDSLNASSERSQLSAKPKQMVQRFWVQWSTEYLHTLQQRRKSQLDPPDEDKYPFSWALGRILGMHPGHNSCRRPQTMEHLPTEGETIIEGQETVDEQTN